MGSLFRKTQKYQPVSIHEQLFKRAEFKFALAKTFPLFVLLSAESGNGLPLWC